MTGKELEERQLRCLQWTGFVASMLACTAVPVVNMALAEEWGAFLGLLPFALLGFAMAYWGFRRVLRHRRAVLAHVDEQLRIVAGRCRLKGLSPLSEYRPAPAPLPNLVRPGEERVAAQQMVDDLLLHAGLSDPVPVRLVDADPMSYIREAVQGVGGNHVAGVYYRDETGTAEIHLVPHARREPKHVLAVLCHEVSHHFLYAHGIADPNPDDNEVQTELAGVYLGFGRQLRKGYAKIHWEVAATYFSDQVGYLRPFVIRHAIRAVRELGTVDEKQVQS